MGILRDLFGPSRDEIWQQFATAVGGNIDKGGFWKGSKVEATHGQWTVTLDTYIVSTGKSSETYTRMRAPFVNVDGFRFDIYRKGIFSDLGKWLGMQDVTVGHPQFDSDFIIKGNDGAKLRRMFDNARIRELMEAQPAIRFSVQTNHSDSPRFPVGAKELYFAVGGVIRDLGELKQLYDLFSETLDELCRMGSAESGVII